MASRLAVILTVIAILVLILLPIAFKNEPDPVETKPQKAPEEAPGYLLDNVTIVGHKNGEKKWELKVKDITDQGKEFTLLKDLEQGELFANGEAKYFFKAGGGEYDRKNDEFKLSHDVLITTKTGESIKTNQVQYSQTNQQLLSGPVEISRKDMNVRAGSMAIDVNNETFDLSGGVEVEFTIDDEDDSTNEQVDANVNGGENTNAKKK